MKRIISILLIFTLILGTSVTVSAATDTKSELDTIEDCIKIDDSGHLYLSDEISKMNFDDTQLANMNDVINSYNDMIDGGYYKLNSITEVIPTEKYYQEIAIQPMGGGRNLALPLTGNIWQIWLNDDVCDKVTAGMNVGSVLAALIPNPIAAVAVAAALTLYSSAIGNANEGNGVTFKINMGAPIPYDIQPQ